MVQYPKCAYGTYTKFNPILNGVYILEEVSFLNYPHSAQKLPCNQTYTHLSKFRKSRNLYPPSFIRCRCYFSPRIPLGTFSILLVQLVDHYYARYPKSQQDCSVRKRIHTSVSSGSPGISIRHPSSSVRWRCNLFNL